MPKSFELAHQICGKITDGEELEAETKKKRDHTIALMKFMGSLFLRRLIPSSVIAAILQDLVTEAAGAMLPGGHEIECACTLLCAVGATLQEDPIGKLSITQTCQRLKELRMHKATDGKYAYQMRLQFVMRDTMRTFLAELPLNLKRFLNME